MEWITGMRLFIDCEFNGAMGSLISLALLSEDGKQHFYEVVDITEPVEPWVKDNVMTVLEKPAIPYAEFQRKLHAFLKKFPAVQVVADHPEDILRLCRCLIYSGGKWMEDLVISFEVNAKISAKASKVPHCAWHDAVALRDSWVQHYGYLTV